MKVSERTIAALGKIATGDPTRSAEQLAPYTTGPALVRFFNEFGSNDVYGHGFGSRWQFAEAKTRKHNGTETLASVIEALLDPRRYIDTDLSVDRAVEYLKEYLRLDGFEVRKVGNAYRVRNAHGATVTVQAPEFPTLSHPYIDEQIEKCDAKVATSDFTGAVTNARTMVEAVLLAIEKEIIGLSQPYDGELARLFKRVQKLLNLEPDRKDIGEHLRCVLSGLTSVVHGLAPLRNKMSDAHPAEYRPARHHATLAVNAAKTVVDFLFETLEYQKKRGLLNANPTAAHATTEANV